jgi:hypothetical protein
MQIDEPDPIVIHQVVKQNVFVEHLLLVHQHTEQRRLPFGIVLEQLEQPLVGSLQILDLHQIGFDQGRSEQAVGPHEQCPVFPHGCRV